MKSAAYVLGLFIREEVAVLGGRCRHAPFLYGYGFMCLRFVLHYPGVLAMAMSIGVKIRKLALME
jgi:hypothetical protein